MKRIILGMMFALGACAGTSLAQGPTPPSCALTPPPVVRAKAEMVEDTSSTPSSSPAITDWGTPSDQPGPRLTVDTDYLMWWVRKGPLPQPMVVTGSPNDQFPGALDQPGTQVLFGGNGVNYGLFAGMRFNGTLWLDADSRFGINGSFFELERRSVAYNAAGNSNGQPYLAEPYTNALSGAQNVYFISQNLPNPALAANLTGGVAIANTTRLWGWETNGTFNLCRNQAWSFDLLGGYRQINLNEGLTNTVVSTDLAVGGAAGLGLTPVSPPYSVTSYDNFQTRNQFNGGQIGGRFDYRLGCVSFNMIGKLGMGNMSEVLTIGGATWTNAPIGNQVAAGGIYAQTSNMGQYTHNAFAVVPECNGNLGIDVTSWLRARVGYTFLYASNVIRPGNQIDPVLNRNLVPIDSNSGTPGGPIRPTVFLKESSFWAQGINFGFEVAF